MLRRIFFKVGQVWKRPTDNFKYKIVSIKNDLVRAETSSTKEIVDFIRLGSDGAADLDTGYWVQIIPTECLCGTNRKVCIYHKPEPYQYVE